jgi:hypothetical protein
LVYLFTVWKYKVRKNSHSNVLFYRIFFVKNGWRFFINGLIRIYWKSQWPWPSFVIVKCALFSHVYRLVPSFSLIQDSG